MTDEVSTKPTVDYDEDHNVKDATEPTVEDVIDKIEPQTDPVEITLTDNDGNSRVYVQKPLTYFNKIAFFGLVGDTVKEAMEGDDPLDVDALFGVGGVELDNLSQEMFGLNGFLDALAKIASYAPNFLKESYIMWLNVPRAEKAWAWEALDNIDDDTGEKIVSTFIEQNYKQLEAFFTSRLPRLNKLVQKLRS